MVDALKNSRTFVRLLLLIMVQHFVSDGKFHITLQSHPPIYVFTGYYIEPNDIVHVSRTFRAYQGAQTTAALEINGGSDMPKTNDENDEDGKPLQIR
jgi:hypothetical protein